MTVCIRAATRDDVSRLCAWNAAMAHETEHKALDAARLRAGVEGMLAHSARGFYLVAEGVETEAQVSFLRAAGCSQLQGFRYGAAVPAAAFDALLDQQH